VITIETNRGTAVIRPVRPEDVWVYRQLRLEALKNHPEAYTSDYETNLAWPEEKWAERLSSPPGGPEKVTFFAEAGGQALGMGTVVRGDSPKTAHTGTVVGIYVQPEWRGSRLSAALIQACEDWARSRGIQILKLAVMSSNAPAIRVYTACGFRVYGVDPRAVLVGRKYYDEILMTKELE